MDPNLIRLDMDHLLILNEAGAIGGVTAIYFATKEYPQGCLSRIPDTDPNAIQEVVPGPFLFAYPKDVIEVTQPVVE